MVQSRIFYGKRGVDSPSDPNVHRIDFVDHVICFYLFFVDISKFIGCLYDDEFTLAILVPQNQI